ncbi:hypothetical protein E1261_27285 [Kribbella albertanoniae]|uniref:Uncharacterized protein n=1 Tax=Kribbella albertanoniae TaxID=1266829 RepID=A0A4V2XQ20_9ACTN|nr:hypothetical protein E1261_27285 [Kribbella albertanoniae]
MDLGSVTAGGDHRSQRITANSPPTRTNDHVLVPGLYKTQVRLSSSMFRSAGASGDLFTGGHVIIGSTLARTAYEFTGPVVDTASIRLTPVEDGFGDVRAFEESRYRAGTVTRKMAYGLHGDGTLSRRTANNGGWGWVVTGAAPGFASVKSMALISKTRTYDTFLANTRGGALSTIHIPTKSPMKPVVKPVRTRTWQGFEYLLAQKCGNYGTLLLGVDKDSQSAYLYYVGHANGTATVIQSVGKVPGTFNDPVYFRFAPILDPHVGE